MPTYYKYAEREADSYINWAEIGKNMSDMLANENKIREEKKAAIDEESRQLGLTLSDYPQGENRLMNEWAMTFSGNMQEARLMQDRLLKQGKLKLNDYMKMRQNSTDGTKTAFDLITDFQTDFKEMWDRMQNDESAGLEQKFAREVEAFGDFAKSDLYINPTDGKVNVAFRDEKVVDGKKVYVMNKNPNNFSEINALRNRIKMRVDKYKLPTQMDAVVNSFGEQIQAMQTVQAQLHQQGMTMEITDILQKEGLPEDLKGVVMGFKDAETNILQSQLANPFNAASILDDYVNTAPNGKLYDYTWDKDQAAANPELILLKNEGGKPVPVLSAEQEKVALEKLRVEARMRYAHKEKLTSTGQIQLQERRPITQTESDEKDKDEEALNFARQTSFLISGDDAQVDGALKYFRGRGANLEKNPPGKPKGIYIENERGEMVPFEMKGKTNDLGTSIVGSLIKATGSSLNDTRIVKYFPKYMKGTFNVTASGSGKAKERDVEGEFETKIGSQITSDLFSGKKSTVTGPKIKQIFANVPGVSVTYSGAGSPYNDVTVTYTNSKGVKTTANLNSNESGDEAKAQAVELKKIFNAIESGHKTKAIGPELNYEGL